MLYLITGGSKAGKSRYAEQLAVKLKENRLLYLATMVPVGDGEAGSACIQRHQAQRSGLGFQTIEKPTSLFEILLRSDDVVLLEDVQNLIGNYLFLEHKTDAQAEALRDIQAIAGRCKALIAVSYSNMQADDSYDDETKAYIEQINQTARLLSEQADAVVLLEQGIPYVVKGMIPAL